MTIHESTENHTKGLWMKTTKQVCFDLPKYTKDFKAKELNISVIFASSEPPCEQHVM